MRTWRMLNAKDVSLNVIGNQKLLKIYEKWGDTKLWERYWKRLIWIIMYLKVVFLNSAQFLCLLFDQISSFVGSRESQAGTVQGGNHGPSSLFSVCLSANHFTRSPFLSLLSNGIINAYPSSSACWKKSFEKMSENAM